MRFSGQFSLDEYELGVLTEIKGFDFYYYNLIRSGRTEETDLHIHMMQLGLPKVIAGFLPSVPAFKHLEVSQLDSIREAHLTRSIAFQLRFMVHKSY